MYYYALDEYKIYYHARKLELSTKIIFKISNLYIELNFNNSTYKIKSCMPYRDNQFLWGVAVLVLDSHPKHKKGPDPRPLRKS